METPDMSANDLLKKIQAAKTKGREEVVPKGFKDAAGWASEWHLDQTCALRNCKDGVKLGLMETKVFLQARGPQVRRVQFFRPLEK